MSMEEIQHQENKESSSATNASKIKIRTLAKTMSRWESVSKKKFSRRVRFLLNYDSVEIQVAREERLFPYEKGPTGEYIRGESKVWIMQEKSEQTEQERKLTRKTFLVDDRNNFLVKEAIVGKEDDSLVLDKALKISANIGVKFPKKKGFKQKIVGLVDDYLMAVANGETDFREGSEKEAQEALMILASVKGKKMEVFRN
jgi:hypothetical protein